MKETWLTLCDDGWVNIHRGSKPRIMQGRHGKYQEDFVGSVPYSVVHLLTGVRLSYWEPVRWDVKDAVLEPMLDEAELSLN